MATSAPPATRSAVLGLLREAVVVVVAALLISFLVKTFLFQVFWIPSVSMQDTLLKGDRVAVTQLVPGPLALHRGDVVVFDDPGGWLPDDTPDGHTLPVHRGPVAGATHAALAWVGVLPDSSRGHLIKRVIGLPGDRVSCAVGGLTTVNGQPVDEMSYLAPGATPSQLPFSVTVPAGHVWVEGDNRQQSRDSRFHQDLPAGGSVATRLIVGRAVARLWPLPRLGWLSGHHDVFAGVAAAKTS